MTGRSVESSLNGLPQPHTLPRATSLSHLVLGVCGGTALPVFFNTAWRNTPHRTCLAERISIAPPQWGHVKCNGNLTPLMRGALDDDAFARAFGGC